MLKAFSRRSPSSQFMELGIAAALGIGLGLILPVVLFRRKRPSNNNNDSVSSQKDDDNNNTGVHVVRAGLEGDADGGGNCIRISREKLDDFVSQILVRGAGCPTEGARLVANVLSYADSRGIPSHGANRADTYVNEILAGHVDPQAVPTVERCSGGCAVIHGHNGLGATVSQFAMNTALQLAKDHGVAVVTCHSSNHYGAAGYWANMALEEGCIGMSFTNTSPIAIPTRSRVRGLGTNPFCCFAPATAHTKENDNGNNKRDSFQLDMATTTVPIGKVEVLDRIGEPAPKGWGVDRIGNDSSDPAEICQFGGLYPLGGAEETAGYKGYGLGMLVEILCSVLSNASVGPDVPPWTVSRTGPLNYGHCFIVVDPERFAPHFEPRLEQYLDRMRSLPSGSIHNSVLVAGDPEKEFEKDAAKKGILLHQPVAITLKALAKKYAVTIPTEFEKLDETQSKASLYE